MFRHFNKDVNGVFGDFDQVFGGIFNQVEKTIKEKGELLLSDIKETTNGFIISADVPGVNKESIKITFDDNELKIEVPERDLDKLEDGENFLLTQRSNLKKTGYFKFKKSVDANSIKAIYKDGVLMVEILKKDKENLKSVIVE